MKHGIRIGSGRKTFSACFLPGVRLNLRLKTARSDLYVIVRGNLNSHDQAGHVEGSELWSDTVLWGGQNANIFDFHGKVDMV